MAARHRSRRRALQVLFEWDMRGDPIDRAIQNYYDTLHSDDGENTQPLKPDRFMEQLARGTAADVSEIDKQIAAKSEHWRVERMAVVDRNILRLAIYELRLAELPAPVVIDEALELARQFSSDESLAFINGVLDAVHRQANAAGGR
ncbi:MAG TPA: transcription antitermination factor NusB [Bryobacteraceae bacterium]